MAGRTNLALLANPLFIYILSVAQTRSYLLQKLYTLYRGFIRRQLLGLKTSFEYILTKLSLNGIFLAAAKKSTIENKHFQQILGAQVFNY